MFICQVLEWLKKHEREQKSNAFDVVFGKQYYGKNQTYNACKNVVYDV